MNLLLDIFVRLIKAHYSIRGAKRLLNGTSKVNRQTDRHTDKQTNKQKYGHFDL